MFITALVTEVPINYSSGTRPHIFTFILLFLIASSAIYSTKFIYYYMRLLSCEVSDCGRKFISQKYNMNRKYNISKNTLKVICVNVAVKLKIMPFAIFFIKILFRIYYKATYLSGCWVYHIFRLMTKPQYGTCRCTCILASHSWSSFTLDLNTCISKCSCHTFLRRPVSSRSGSTCSRINTEILCLILFIEKRAASLETTDNFFSSSG